MNTVAPKMLMLLFAAAGVFASPAAEAAPKYQWCWVAAGVASCPGVAYNGRTPTQPGLLWRWSTIRDGQVFSSDHTFTGDVIQEQNGKYVQCSVKGGNVFSCNNTGYTGEAVLLK